jgi:hypothetical protein
MKVSTTLVVVPVAASSYSANVPEVEDEQNTPRVLQGSAETFAVAVICLY